MWNPASEHVKVEEASPPGPRAVKNFATDLVQGILDLSSKEVTIENMFMSQIKQCPCQQNCSLALTDITAITDTRKDKLILQYNLIVYLTWKWK